MLISAAPLSDSRRLVGLQTLIAPNAVLARTGDGDRRYVATRSLKASPRAVGFPRGGADGDGEEDQMEESEGGCWVMYGWRRRPRRLPPMIPSLRRHGSAPWALARARTSDGRVVVSTEPAPPRERVVATKAGGRLVLDLVERHANSPPPPPPPPRRLRSRLSISPQAAVSPASAAATGDGVIDAEEEAGAATAAAEGATGFLVFPAAMLSAAGSGSGSPPLHPALALPPPPLVCSEGYYDDVIRASSSLPKMPLILPRMVH
uniref:FAF domain-containing protein n=1 Tax=Leersia perrieri TaxID=77586 RepID=A0A0D9WNG4_9ORYZ